MVGTDVARRAPTGAPGVTADAPSDPPAEVADRERRAFSFGVHGISIVVMAIGIAVVAALTVTTRTVYVSNEKHLLRQRVNEAGAVLTAASAGVQSPLSSAAILADATNGRVADFRHFVTPLSTGKPFISVSLWSADATKLRPLVVVGTAPELARGPAERIRAVLLRARASANLSVVNELDQPVRRLGYAISAGPGSHYVVFAEADRPSNRRASVDSNTAFSDLDYAIYLGTTADRANLLASSIPNAAFQGRTASTGVAFGDSHLLLVMTPRRPLGGAFLARLPWIIAVLGLAIAAAAALLAERLVGGREKAERLALINAELFSEQRSVAKTLQHSLLPDVLPSIPGLTLAVRYVPGVDGVDVGGDWYDVIDLGAGNVLFVVGDVSGRGVRAATVMASLRYAIRAFASEGDGPEVILTKLCGLIDVGRDGHFATVLCGLVDVAERRVSLANAGHPDPLVVTREGATFAGTHVGPPIGVDTQGAVATTVTVPPGGVLLAFTDGLFERRGEDPDVSLARLRDATGGYESLEVMLDGMLRELTPAGAHDDTAILAMTWVQ